MRLSSYRRLVLGLQSARMDVAVLRAAASLAKSLGLEMHAILVENQSLLRAANLPMTRELVLPTYDWRPANPDRLLGELNDEAQIVRSRIAHEMREFGIECGFEVRRGDPAIAVTEHCSVRDIIAVIDSVDAIERLSDMAKRMRHAALTSKSSVLLLPPLAAVRSEGPVVAVASDFRDQTLVVASHIAEVSGRALVVLMAKTTGGGVAPPDRATVQFLAEPSVSCVLRTLDGRRDCFLVMNRSVIDLTPPSTFDHIATDIGMPVLMTEASPTISRPTKGKVT